MSSETFDAISLVPDDGWSSDRLQLFVGILDSEDDYFVQQLKHHEKQQGRALNMDNWNAQRRQYHTQASMCAIPPNSDHFEQSSVLHRFIVLRTCFSVFTTFHFCYRKDFVNIDIDFNRYFHFISDYHVKTPPRVPADSLFLTRAARIAAIKMVAEENESSHAKNFAQNSPRAVPRGKNPFDIRSKLRFLVNATNVRVVGEELHDAYDLGVKPLQTALRTAHENNDPIFGLIQSVVDGHGLFVNLRSSKSTNLGQPAGGRRQGLRIRNRRNQPAPILIPQAPGLNPFPIPVPQAPGPNHIPIPIPQAPGPNPNPQAPAAIESAQTKRLKLAQSVAKERKEQENQENEERRKRARVQNNEDMTNLVNLMMKGPAVDKRDVPLSEEAIVILDSFATLDVLLRDSPTLFVEMFIDHVSLRFIRKMFIQLPEDNFIQKLKSNGVSESNASDLFDYLNELVQNA
jgi:hypothetical protein